MSDFATMDDIVSALAGASPAGTGGRFNFNKSSVTSVTGIPTSTWLCAGVPLAGATPTTWATCTPALQGAYNPNMVNSSPATSRLLQATIIGGQAGATVWIADRIGHMGGLSGTSTSAQSTGANGNTGTWASSRCASDYSDVEWYLEWYSSTGSTSVTATCAVTYSDGTTGNAVAITVPASMIASRMIQIVPGAAGKFIKSVDSVQLSASTGTAGNFGVTAWRRLAGATPIASNYSATVDFASMAMPQVYDNTCLCLIIHASATSLGTNIGTIVIGSA